MKLATIYKDQNCLYLTQDLSGMGIYDRAKAIVNFCDKETKLFEKEIDRAIIDIFEKNGINIPSTDKNVLKLAFDLLKSKGVEIVITDLFKDIRESDLIEKIKETKNNFVVMLETEYICGCEKITIECGVEIKEQKL